jgi:hypothetical protein
MNAKGGLEPVAGGAGRRPRGLAWAALLRPAKTPIAHPMAIRAPCIGATPDMNRPHVRGWISSPRNLHRSRWLSIDVGIRARTVPL